MLGALRVDRLVGERMPVQAVRADDAGLITDRYYYFGWWNCGRDAEPKGICSSPSSADNRAYASPRSLLRWTIVPFLFSPQGEALPSPCIR